MNSTLFSIKGGGNGFQRAKPVRWVARTVFAEHPLPTMGTRPTQVSVPWNKRALGARVSGRQLLRDSPSPRTGTPVRKEGRALSVPQGYFMQVEGSG